MLPFAGAGPNYRACDRRSCGVERYEHRHRSLRRHCACVDQPIDPRPLDALDGRLLTSSELGTEGPAAWSSEPPTIPRVRSCQAGRTQVVFHSSYTPSADPEKCPPSSTGPSARAELLDRPTGHRRRRQAPGLALSAETSVPPSYGARKQSFPTDGSATQIPTTSCPYPTSSTSKAEAARRQLKNEVPVSAPHLNGTPPLFLARSLRLPTETAARRTIRPMDTSYPAAAHIEACNHVARSMTRDRSLPEKQGDLPTVSAAHGCHRRSRPRWKQHRETLDSPLVRPILLSLVAALTANVPLSSGSQQAHSFFAATMPSPRTKPPSCYSLPFMAPSRLASFAAADSGSDNRRADRGILGHDSSSRASTIGCASSSAKTDFRVSVGTKGPRGLRRSRELPYCSQAAKKVVPRNLSWGKLSLPTRRSTQNAQSSIERAIRRPRTCRICFSSRVDDHRKPRNSACPLLPPLARAELHKEFLRWAETGVQDEASRAIQGRAPAGLIRRALPVKTQFA